MAARLITEKLYTNEGNAEVLKNITESMKYILDVGCGAGDNSKVLHSKGKICDGITISESEAKVAAQYQEHTYIFNLENGLPPEINRTYDAVICSHVLEHICYPQPVLKDIRAKMHKDSILIVALPNIMHYRYRKELMKGNFDYTDTGIMDYTHFRWYTFQSAQQMLRDNGFEVTDAWAISNMGLTPIIRNLPNGMRNAIVNFALSISRGFFGIEMFFVAKIKP